MHRANRQDRRRSAAQPGPGRLAGALLATSLLLAACGSANVDDLRQFTENAFKGRKPKIEPLPRFRPQKGFRYTAADLVDPFSTANLRPLKPRTGAAQGGRAPDPNRRKEPLEAYPLDSLAMVGTLAKGNQTWAILRAPDGSVHHAHTGNYVGENFGKITAISDTRVSIKELIQGPSNNWIEREASLAITD